MALEIERKWLIDPAALPLSLERFECHRIEQSYLSFSPQIRLRAIDDTRFVLTVKGKASGQKSPLVRDEHEHELTEEAYAKLRGKTEGKTLLKKRYVIPEEAVSDALPASATSAARSGRFFEIDVYEGEFSGLAVAEMEFASLEEAEAYPTPTWAKADVSADSRYRNVVMAQGD